MTPDIEHYLRSELTDCATYQLTETDQRLIADQGIESLIFKSLTSKKFRKWAIDEKTTDMVRQAIHLSVEGGQSIQLTLPFGAYKLWRLPSSPEVDWAEFFTIAYYCRYFAPVVAAYEPGLAFTFWSDDIVVEELNNVSQENTLAYRSSLQELLQYFKKYFPTNLSIEFRRVADLYPERADYERDVALQLTEVKKIFPTFPDKQREQMLKMSKLNIQWDGVRDLTGLSEDEQAEFIEHSAILHDAFRHIPRRRAAVRAEKNIVIFPDHIANSIGLGSTSSSVTKFWTGVGVLEQRADRFVDRVLSPDQFERMKDVDHAIHSTNLIPMKNFSEISIYSKTFDFS